MIEKFEGKLAFLSNLWKGEIPSRTGETIWPSIPHLFFWQKLDGKLRTPELKAQVLKMGIDEVQLWGRTLKAQPKWEMEKVGIMYRCLQLKFKAPNMANALLGTGDELLIDGNEIDGFWGIYPVPKTPHCLGQNNLGMLLMRIRAELRGGVVSAGTGHRPKKLFRQNAYSNENYAFLQGFLIDWLEKVPAEHRPEYVISGMALGYDQALAEAAFAVGIPVIAAIPHRDHPGEWPQASKDRYKEILSHCKGSFCLADSYNGSVMQARNEWMINHSNSVLALWDGSEGGTGNCIEYATQQKTQICNLWEDYKAY